MQYSSSSSGEATRTLYGLATTVRASDPRLSTRAIGANHHVFIKLDLQTRLFARISKPRWSVQVSEDDDVPAVVPHDNNDAIPIQVIEAPAGELRKRRLDEFQAGARNGVNDLESCRVVRNRGVV